jgi:hypothetical protein
VDAGVRPQRTDDEDLDPTAMPVHRTTTAPPAPEQPSRLRPPETEPEVEQEPGPRFDLSLTQVLGGALAAMTAAALGSRLGLAGTVVGAALASVVAAVGGSIYTASLRRTRDRVRSVLTGRPQPTAGTPTVAAPGVPAAVTARPLPRLDGSVDTSVAKRRRRRALVVRSLVGALVTFVLAAVAVTAVEAATGGALSGGDQTTFSQVQQGDSRQADEPQPTPSERSVPSPSASESASSQSSASPEPAPSATTEPSTPAPSDQPTAATPSTEPSSPSGIPGAETGAQPSSGTR